jgi:sulfoxide reductase heme-binding subunit YedZ
MSNAYRTVQWNAHKRAYDLIMVGGIVAYMAIFVAGSMLMLRGERAIDPPIVLMRASGTCAVIMLHIILCIGPLARLERRFAPLLYNRRHLGVSMFLVSLLHAAVAFGYYGAFGIDSPIAALLARSPGAAYASTRAFPFEVLGFGGLLILFVMAATSHDFWLANLGARAWKWLHMCVYLAYAMLIMHVALGAMQSERSMVYPALLGLGVATVGTLHLVAGWRQMSADARSEAGPSDDAGWVDVCDIDDIKPDRARVVCLKSRTGGGNGGGGDGASVAVFRHARGISAISNVCAHQGGPLGEGKVVDGCVTCPWHGYQYLPESGQSPPPFTEKIPTYQVRVNGRRVLVNPVALAPGTAVEPARIVAAARTPVRDPGAEATHE